MKTSCCLWAGTILALSAAATGAQEFPRTGEAEYDTYYLFETLASMDSGVGSGGIDEFSGITRNVEGSGPFHGMTVHCVGHWTSIKGEFDFAGSCAETDTDGHTVFTTFDNENHYIVGGTGKYAGITGKAPYTVVQLHETAGGRIGRVVSHKVSWEIK